jgi:hypothetical protein
MRALDTAIQHLLVQRYLRTCSHDMFVCNHHPVRAVGNQCNEALYKEILLRYLRTEHHCHNNTIIHHSLLWWMLSEEPKEMKVWGWQVGTVCGMLQHLPPILVEPLFASAEPSTVSHFHETWSHIAWSLLLTSLSLFNVPHLLLTSLSLFNVPQQWAVVCVHSFAESPPPEHILHPGRLLLWFHILNFLLAGINDGFVQGCFVCCLILGKIL